MNKCICNSLQDAYIRRYTLCDGKESGLKVVELNNGKTRVLLNESKGLDVMQMWYRGENVSFVSKNGFTAREIPFLKRFEGGMLYTCGLDSVGGREGFELHGCYHNLPSKIIALTQDEDVLTVVGVIENTALFGENLKMARKVMLDKNGVLSIEDSLNNEGLRDENYCLLYHINVGYPMLSQGVEIIADLEEVTPRTQHSSEHMEDRAVFSAPIDNEEERAYFLKNKGNTISAKNSALGRMFTITYSKETLPYLIQWSSPASQDYALGLEPSTTLLDDGFEYKTLKAGECVNFSIKMSVKDI